MITERQPEPHALQPTHSRQSVLIVDDSAMNRMLLSQMLNSQFDTAEAASGEDCLRLLEQNPTGISVVLLDIHMTGIDGFTVLEAMSQRGMLEEIPVIMISSEDNVDTVRRAFDLGASDYISRPFDARVVYQRITNTIRMYAKQRRLSAMVADQVSQKEKRSQMMIGILSRVVERRNGESRTHVQHISTLTGMLLDHLVQKTDAHGSYEIQELQLQSFAAAKPDAVICIPNLDECSVSPFRKHLPRRTKVLFSSCVPTGFTANQYDCCIASNMVESGKQASWLLGKYMTAHGLTHAAYLCYGGDSQPARHRDRSAISILEEEFPLITLDKVVQYTEETQAYTMINDLLRELPQIEALYISQSRMAEAVLGVLSLLGRTDIKVVTQGVSKEVIDQLDEHSNVIGVVVPNSYEIGRLLAYACAHYFLGVEPAPFVAVDPVAFTPQNLSGAWLSVMKNKLT